MDDDKLATRPDERVYSAIYDAVQEQRLAPGEKLKEVELSRIFQVSRASIRSAFQRLSHQGLLSIAPNRGARVASPTAEDCRQIFDARAAIESAIVDELARCASPADLLALRRHVTKQRKAFQAGDTKKGQMLAIDFHRLLGRLSANRVLARFLDELLSRMPLVVLTRGGAQGPADAARRDHEGHRELVDAIASGGGGAAVRVLRGHLREVEAALMQQRLHSGTVSMAEIFGEPAAAKAPTARASRSRARA